MSTSADGSSLLRTWTQARVAVGRVGSSVPTQAHLAFTVDHAQARDAVHATLDMDALTAELAQHAFSTLRVTSRARDRSEYLRRPDLGRRLDATSAALLSHGDKDACRRLTIVVADGLSALAPARHAVPMLLRLRDFLPEWQIDSIVLATQARVALADEVGALRQAEATLILIGERPGLKSPDSLGAYLTYAPRVGRSDAERNCVSNIRSGGLPYDTAAHRLMQLLQRARLIGASGVRLKEDAADTPPLPIHVEENIRSLRSQDDAAAQRRAYFERDDFQT